jgi:hypothetical protein
MWGPWSRRRVVLMRTFRTQPPLGPPRGKAADRSRIDIVGPGKICLAFATSEPLEGLLTLIGRQLGRPAKTHPALFGALSALICASLDQVPLKRR